MRFFAAILPLFALALIGADPIAKPKATETDSAIVRGNNKFAADLYRELAKSAKSGENLWFSPFSVQSALAMTYAGARGQTAEEMAKVLHFDADQEAFGKAFGELSRRVIPAKQSEKAELHVANSLWIDKRLPLRDGFKTSMTQDFAAGLKRADFAGSAETERKRINAWVGERTRGMIPDLLSNGDLDAKTRMALVNAIYFKAPWKMLFGSQATLDGKFHLSKTDSVDVKMMSISADFKSFSNKDPSIGYFAFWPGSHILSGSPRGSAMGRPVRQCLCETCRAGGPAAGHHGRLNLILSRLDEQQRRWVAALEALRLGYGGFNAVAAVTGLHPETIRRGRDELDAGLRGRPAGRVRLPGGGGVPLEKKSPDSSPT